MCTAVAVVAMFLCYRFLYAFPAQAVSLLYQGRLGPSSCFHFVPFRFIYRANEFFWEPRSSHKLNYDTLPWSTQVEHLKYYCPLSFSPVSGISPQCPIHSCIIIWFATQDVHGVRVRHIPPRFSTHPQCQRGQSKKNSGCWLAPRSFSSPPPPRLSAACLQRTSHGLLARLFGHLAPKRGLL